MEPKAKPHLAAFLKHTTPPISGPTPQETKLRKQLEDWAHRLKGAADEAGDNGQLALESDLLDLRDEVVHYLHNLLLS